MKPPTPAISVVIATRNRRALLSEAIDTVFDQTRQDWELLVVDDASTDDTSSYVASLSDPRVRLFRQPERSERSRSRNRGLAEARGEFIMFLDDDDLLRPATLASLASAMGAHTDAVAAAGPCRVLQDGGDSIRVWWPSGFHRKIIWRELLFGCWANSGQNLFRTAAVRAIGGFDESLVACEDRRLWLNIALRGPVCLVPQVAMEYRMHAGQHKPPDIDEIRRGVWNEFIAALPPREEAQALRTRRAAELVAASALARQRRRFGPAFLLQTRACRTAPWLLASPLTARPLWWGVKKCILRSPAA